MSETNGATLTSVSINPEIDTSDIVPFAHADVNGALSTYRAYPATSFADNSATFSIIPPSYDVFLNRRILQITPIEITIVGTVTAPQTLMLAADEFALRSLVELRGLTSQSVTINGLGFPVNTSFDTYPDILCHYSKKYRYSHPLGANDVFADYFTGRGMMVNPLADIGSSTLAKGGMMRGSFPLSAAITQSATGATLKYDVMSWIYLPDLLGLDCSHKTGLIRIRNFNLDQVFTTDASRWLSVMSGPNATTVTSATVKLSGQPIVYCKYITPGVEMIPRGVISYPHRRWERFSTALGGNLTTNQSSSISTNNIQLGYIPKHCFIFVRDSDEGMRSVFKTNTFCGLTNISIMFNNQNSLLSTARVYDLWTMSRECGLIDSFVQFSGLALNGVGNVGTTGSLFCAEFGRHISFGSPQLTVNSQGMFNFSAIVQFTNYGVTTLTNPTAYVLFSYDQNLQCDPSGRFSYSIPDTNVAVSASGGAIVKTPYISHSAGGTTGGSFRDFVGKAHNWVKDNKLVSRAIRTLAPLAPIPGMSAMADPLASMVEQMGYGTMSRKEIHNRIKNM